jgi:phage shock protein A
MSQKRHRGLFQRMGNLLRGLFAGWIRDRENRNPRAVYEQAIAERTRQYAELKQAVAGILYMRNKLEAEIQERRAEIAQAHQDICRSVQRGDDDVALAMISHKETLLADLERAEREIEDVKGEVEAAKGNLVRFRGEIRQLEREKVRMMATLANARARRRFQEALEGLSLDGEMRALEQVREHIQRAKTEARLDHEMGDDRLQSRIKEIRREAREEGARRELEELKRRLRPGALPVAAAPEPAAARANGADAAPPADAAPSADA